MLDDSDLTAVQLQHVPHEISTYSEFTLAPGEGQVPISIFGIEDSKYLSFAIIFCGQRRCSNSEFDVNVYHSDTCKYELQLIVHKHNLGS